MIAVVSGVLIRDRRIFLQQRALHREGAFMWETPGGKVEPGENPLLALKREWKEELDLDVLVGVEPIFVARFDASFTKLKQPFEVSFYRVETAAVGQAGEWVNQVPKLLDGIGCGWFNYIETVALSGAMIPGTRYFLQALAPELL